MRTFETVSLTDATPEQVRTYAQQFLGIPVADDDDGAVLAKVRAATEGDTIFVATAIDDTDQTGSAPLNPEQGMAGSAGGGGLVGSLGRDDPKVQLTLHAEERDGVVVNRHKEVGVNGVVWLLKRGESITIPYRVFEALQNAERHVITHTTEGEVREQKVKNSPFNVERMPTAEEISDFHARTDNVLAP